MNSAVAVQLFAIALISGLLLVGAEVFVPGGILGAVGGLALLTAAVIAFAAFGPMAGGYVALAIVLLVAVSIMLWIRIFPRTRIGKKMTVARDLSQAKGTDSSLESLVGKEGEAISDLRPSGFARIDGERVDVITQGVMIHKGEKIRVVETESNRVVVKHV